MSPFSNELAIQKASAWNLLTTGSEVSTCPSTRSYCSCKMRITVYSYAGRQKRHQSGKMTPNRQDNRGGNQDNPVLSVLVTTYK